MSRALLVGLALIALVTTAPTPSIAERVAFDAVDDAARDAVLSNEIPGVVVLVGEGDTILLHRAYGWRAVVPTPVPMTTDTIFDIASLTKPLGTTLAVMSLVERGALSLDAPLGRYLSEFRGAKHRGVTIRRLLTHSAGFPAIPPDGRLTGGFPRAAKALARLPFDYPPGAAFQYSDTGFILLGEVVRRVAGQRLDRYLERMLFRPLGLRDTSFRPSAGAVARVAPTEFHHGHMLHGEVHDPNARLLGGVAGHAGMFSTASDLGRICRMLLNQGVLDGRRLFRPETIRLMWDKASEGNGTRALGWDISSPFSAPFGPFFPAGSVGHTGFTGTAVWIDPASRSYVILLTNRVHPAGGGTARIRELRTRVAAAAGAELFRSAFVASTDMEPTGPAADASPMPSEAERLGAGGAVVRVRSGLDVVVDQQFGILKGHSVGLVTNQTGVDAQGRRGIDLIASAPGVRLAAIFSPEHGITGTANSDVPDGRDFATRRPIWSLYGASRRPTASMLKDVTALVFDIQDVGVRYYTYLTTLIYVMEVAADHGLPVIVLDRPNPLTGRVVEGPVMDPDLRSFIAPYPVPVRTGLTIGEFARLVAAERKLSLSLTVVPLAGWTRSRWYDETGLAWINPSPNIRSVTQALLYAGVGLLEGTNLSVGRGTGTPFEIVGAPWVEPFGLAETLNREGLRGVRFEPTWFTPGDDKYAHVSCGGVRLIVTDRDAVRPVTVALALAGALRDRHRAAFRPESIQSLLVNRATMWAFLRGEPLDRVLAWSEMDRGNFLNRRASYLIYQ